mmetsp:Transcript_28576/g.59518  ORF Transcript_28576/g.59518 Transcript_28576/m.59518 type:complete len:339 (-) Transcript_28576:102-1118(-)
MKRSTLVTISGIALAHQASHISAWSPTQSSAFTSISSSHRSEKRPSCRPLAMSSTDKEIDMESLHLTPELEMMTKAFARIPDEKTRHKQLLYMASKLEEVGDDVRVPENKVPGCLSTVHVDCVLVPKEDDESEKVVKYFGDSDGLLTKGLLALLIRGLSGCTPEQISKVDPKFIQAAKISQTLTPGRNNGFLNMLAVMKKKAVDAADVGTNGDEITATNDDKNGDVSEAETIDNASREIVTSFEEIEGKPMYNAIMSTLITLLKPNSISLVDNSHQHAGHGGAKGWEESGESHFQLEIVAEAFEGLSLVKRHQLIYMVLGEVMSKIHALEIRAKSPSD